MLRTLGLLVVLGAALLTHSPVDAKSKAPIQIALTGDTAQILMAKIAGAALKKAGFKVGFVEMPAADLIAAMAAGKIHLQPVYQVSEDSAYSAALGQKKIHALGGLNGNKRDAPVQKLVWGGMKKKWPYARKMLKTMIFPVEELDALAARAETEGVDPVVADWMKTNKRRWKRWVSASTNWMKP